MPGAATQPQAAAVAALVPHTATAGAATARMAAAFSFATIYGNGNVMVM